MGRLATRSEDCEPVRVGLAEELLGEPDVEARRCGGDPPIRGRVRPVEAGMGGHAGRPSGKSRQRRRAASADTQNTRCDCTAIALAGLPLPLQLPQCARRL